MVLAVQLFNKIKKKKKKEKKKMTKNMKKQVSLYFLGVVEIHLFLVNLFFFVCFRH